MSVRASTELRLPIFVDNTTLVRYSLLSMSGDKLKMRALSLAFFLLASLLSHPDLKAANSPWPRLEELMEAIEQECC